MTKDEKIAAIVEAVNSGVCKRKLDPKLNGRDVRNLLNGESVTERKIDEIYENLQAHQENSDVGKDRLEAYRKIYPEVATETKIRTILTAVESGQCSKNGLDPVGTGNAVRDLEKGKTIGIARINEMYDKVLKITGDSKKQRAKAKARQCQGTEAKTKKEEKKSLANKGDAGKTPENTLEKRLKEQEKQIGYLLNQVSLLEAKVTQLAAALEQVGRPLKVEGITVTQKTDIVAGKKYTRWYGICRENGKQRWIYIGKDKNKAEEKIKRWIGKNRGACK